MSKLINFVRGLFATVGGASSLNSSDIAIVGRIEEQRKALTKLEKSLARLIYERKLTEVRIKDLQQESTQLHLDLNNALESGNDAAAIELLRRKEAAEAHLLHYGKQKDELEAGIVELKNAGKGLVQRLQDSGAQAEMLKSKRQLLEIRKMVQKDISGLSGILKEFQLSESPFDRELLKVEAEEEVLKLNRKSAAPEIAEIRHSRSQKRLQEQLAELKRSLKAAKIDGKREPQIGAQVSETVAHQGV